LREGENAQQAMRRGEHFEFPYDREHFKDRYTRQHRDEPCSTIVAHLSKDGLMFVHPTQNRSLTPREAARVQSFPDWFQFPVPRTQQFRLIGNAVPPLVAEALGLAVRSYLEAGATAGELDRRTAYLVPRNDEVAADALSNLLNLATVNQLRNAPDEQFREGWFALCFLCPELHPNSALHHGTKISADPLDVIPVRHIDAKLLGPCYTQSGWPVMLEPLVKEAWRRYRANELTDNEFYCSAAASAGIAYGRRQSQKPAFA